LLTCCYFHVFIFFLSCSIFMLFFFFLSCSHLLSLFLQEWDICLFAFSMSHSSWVVRVMLFGSLTDVCFLQVGIDVGNCWYCKIPRLLQRPR
jgi:hypothetical protein